MSTKSWVEYVTFLIRYLSKLFVVNLCGLALLLTQITTIFHLLCKWLCPETRSVACCRRCIASLDCHSPLPRAHTHTHTDKRGPAILAVLTLMLDTDDHGREVGLLKGTWVSSSVPGLHCRLALMPVCMYLHLVTFFEFRDMLVILVSHLHCWAALPIGSKCY